MPERAWHFAAGADDKTLGFSERYFARLFREQTKHSIGQYLRTAQIAKAQSYLTDTELPLKKIAARLGFSAASNFFGAFRTVTGVTPGHLRQVNRAIFAITPM
ncbi:helix-turn-helix transcriptional regulator [Peristeroidobacter agariperforans]|uniref:helix-turn-helix transcriptional regulator n=1 Tax=Peristeroidobacter agariperforans TaxID=268404 RepID=UPI0013004249|nr:helix-turn-helix transcriptional regulator [Peristeroidobacter agariperforans]